MYEITDIMTADKVKTLMQPVLDKGCFFDYFYEKGGDSSCVYICRYKKGKDFFDWRETSGTEEINVVVFVNGAYDFPSLKSLYKKEFRAFSVKHLLKKPTMDEKRAFIAELLIKELLEKPNFFGIK